MSQLNRLSSVRIIAAPAKHAVRVWRLVVRAISVLWLSGGGHK